MDELTAQAKAARATLLLVIRGEMTTAELVEELGLPQRRSLYHIMDNLSLAGVPIYKPDVGRWALLRDNRDLDRMMGDRSISDLV